MAFSCAEGFGVLVDVGCEIWPKGKGGRGKERGCGIGLRQWARGGARR